MAGGVENLERGLTEGDNLLIRYVKINWWWFERRELPRLPAGRQVGTSSQ